MDSFVKYGCSGKLSIVGDEIRLSSQLKHDNAGSAAVSQFQYIAKPQFFGFTERDRGKGVPYRVWRSEVESTIKEGLHSGEIIAKQIRRSLQGEAKSKVVGFGSETSLSVMLSQFYKEDGGTTSDEMLAEAYKWKRALHEEVAAFASRLDNQVRKAKVRGTDLLPDESAVDKHLRVLFWDGRAPQTVLDDPRNSVEGIPDNPPKWFSQMYGSMPQEVKTVVSPPKENAGRQMASTGGGWVD